jgi:hypothetical protein
MEINRINKKAHHEIGFAPYALLVALISSVVLYFRNKLKRKRK